VKDKQQLFETIDQLDEKKKRELVIAHKQINIVSGFAFSQLQTTLFRTFCEGFSEILQKFGFPTFFKGLTS
jgi:hypothetical protein